MISNITTKDAYNRPRGLGPGLHRRAHDRPHGLVDGPQTRLRRGQGAEHERYKGGRAEPPLHARAGGTLHEDDFSSHGRGAPGRGTPLQGLPLLRADADGGRAEGDRVQLPIRGPRGSGRAAPPGERPVRDHAGGAGGASGGGGGPLYAIGRGQDRRAAARRTTGTKPAVVNSTQWVRRAGLRAGSR